MHQLTARLIAVSILVTACKSKPQETAPAASTTAPAAEAPPAAEKNARMGSIYADDFAGQWPVEASYINLICERTSANDHALMATVDGSTYALNTVARELRLVDGSVPELQGVLKADADPQQAVAMLTERASALCNGL